MKIKIYFLILLAMALVCGRAFARMQCKITLIREMTICLMMITMMQCLNSIKPSK